MQLVRRSGGRQHPLQDAEIAYGEVSWRFLPGMQPDDGNAGSDALIRTGFKIDVWNARRPMAPVLPLNRGGFRHVPPAALGLGYIMFAAPGDPKNGLSARAGKLQPPAIQRIVSAQVHPI